MTNTPASNTAKRAPAPNWAREVGWMLVAAAAYFVAAAFCIELSRRPGAIAALWVANALIVALQFQRRSGHPAFLLGGAAIGGLLANLFFGNALPTALGLTVANLVEIVVANTLVRLAADHPAAQKSAIGRIILVLVAGAVAPGAGAPIGASILATEGGLPFWHVYSTWWLGSGAGMLLILPIVLTATPEALHNTFRGRGLVHFVLLVAFSLGIGWTSLLMARFPLLFMALPIGIAAIWIGPFVTAIIRLILVTMVITAAATGRLGLFAVTGATFDPSLYFVVSSAALLPFFMSLVIVELRKEQARLRRSERQARNMMEHAAIGMALVGPDGAFLQVNRSLCDMLGYGAAELQALTFQEITHPDDLKTDLDLVEKALASEIDTFRMEKRYFRKDGSVMWALLAASIIREAGRRSPAYFISQIEDITARKAAEAALEKSESRWTFALESADSGVWDLDVPSNQTFYSPVWCRLLGFEFSKAPTAGDSWVELIHPDDRERILKANDDCLAGRVPDFEQEFRMRHQSGRWIWVLDRGKVIERAADGSPLRMIGIITDISKLKDVEAALEASESRWSFALESARQGVWDFDLRTGKTFLSPVWKAIIGYREDEVSDENGEWLRFVHPDDMPVLRKAEVDYRTGVTPLFECEFRMRHKDGSWIWILDRGKCVDRGPDGRMLRIIGTHTDITSRKEAEAKISRLSQRMGLAVKAGGVGLWEYDHATKKFWWDGKMAELYGAGNSERTLTYEEWLEHIHPDDRQRTLDVGRASFYGDAVYDLEFRVILPGGRLRHIRALADTIRDANGKTTLMVGTNWDITEHKRLTEALVQEKERLHITLQSIGDAVISTDNQRRITFINPSAEELTGWPAEEALGRPLDAVFFVVDELTGTAVPSVVDECLMGLRTKSSRESVTLLSRTGARRDIRDTAAPLTTAEGEIIGAVLVFQDMTEARRLQRQLTHSATHDALTGLANRVSFERALRAACDSAASDMTEHALGFIDLDRFKIINDTAGHAAGDALLREIGRVVRQNVRGTDVMARIGGDEFGFLLYDCPVEQAELVATKIIESIRTIPFAWDGRLYDVAASIGITVVSAASHVPGELLSQADIACYAAKGNGRSRLVVYRSDESEAVRHHRDLHVAAQIRGAIETDRFRLYAQEIRPLGPPKSKERHIEILLRMLDEDGSVLEPSSFIPAAERYDLMANIDRWVVRAVLRSYGERIRAHGDLSVFINLSANSLNEPDFAAFLSDELRSSVIPPGRFNIEITETALINNWSASTKVIGAARAAGAAIVLDDFGTGLSSFAYLKRFPVDYLKIDGSFMHNLRDSGVDRAIVESINDIAHKLGAETIAECIEDAGTIDIVRAMGVDHAQGFAIAAPVPFEEILDSATGRRAGLRLAG